MMTMLPVATAVTFSVGLLVVLPFAAILGRVLTWSVSRLVEPHPHDRRTCRGVEIATVLAAVALWWWEVVRGSQLPDDILSVPATDLVMRFVAHAIVLGFLAAAAWIDLRHRVIPDAITVPGVLTGLAWNTLFPSTLLPIATYVERSFATPEVRLDVLSIAGGLEAVGISPWLDGITGLVIAAGIVAGWWWVGTAPDEPSAPWSRLAWFPSGRVVVGLLAATCLAGAGLAGGRHWAGFATAITGLAVSGGVVWATRIGASLALRREAMGFGDVTLMAMAGAWLGWQASLLACLLGVFIGLIHGISQVLTRSESELPFGPSLCLGLLVVIVGWRPIWERAAPQFERPGEMAIVAALVIVLTAVTLWGWAKFRGPVDQGPDAVSRP